MTNFDDSNLEVNINGTKLFIIIYLYLKVFSCKFILHIIAIFNIQKY